MYKKNKSSQYQNNLRNRLVTFIFVTKQLHNKMRRDVFQAIADPVRREIIGLLANKTLTVNAVADNFAISRPAISKHLRILNECGIVEIQKKGRERYCVIQPKKLVPVSNWIEQYRELWEEKLDSFENYLNQLQSQNKRKD